VGAKVFVYVQHGATLNVDDFTRDALNLRRRVQLRLVECPFDTAVPTLNLSHS
jgi:hypothetical protein